MKSIKKIVIVDKKVYEYALDLENLIQLQIIKEKDKTKKEKLKEYKKLIKRTRNYF